jgi:membrane dipeptidase
MLIIDAHEDFAYNALNNGRDYRLSAAEIRQREAGSPQAEKGGQATLGYPDYQRGQVGLIFGTVFTCHKRYASSEFDKLVFTDFSQARRIYHQQIDYYHALVDRDYKLFRPVRNRKELAETLGPWLDQPAEFPAIQHPVGILMLMEGGEGVEDPGELEEYWRAGLRIIGPVWSGGHWCGGTIEPGGFTRQGFGLLEVMAELGYVLDISHMNTESSLQALEAYEGTIIASHANPRKALKNPPNERHLTDDAIRRLVERDGVMGIVPFNGFIDCDWRTGDDRSRVRLEHVAGLIDHVCQLAGDARHVAIGTDFDGGFGYPAIPFEMNTIADLQKLGPVLTGHGYAPQEIEGIFSGNWQRILEKALPVA